MDEAMLSGFFDELEKIGTNASYQSSSQNVMTSPAPSFTPPKPLGKGSLQPKSTNYSMVHSEEPVAAYGSAAGAKMVPPPPVRT
jgi:hypothetical protein